MTTAIFFIICTAVISFTVEREIDPNFNKDWFEIGFVTPSSDTQDFILKNHSGDISFRYVLQSEGKIILEETVSVGNGEMLTVHPDTAGLQKPYTLSVFPENDPKKSESLTRK